MSQNFPSEEGNGSSNSAIYHRKTGLTLKKFKMGVNQVQIISVIKCIEVSEKNIYLSLSVRPSNHFFL